MHGSGRAFEDGERSTVSGKIDNVAVYGGHMLSSGIFIFTEGGGGRRAAHMVRWSSYMAVLESINTGSD